jgi:hypothetical protein
MAGASNASAADNADPAAVDHMVFKEVASVESNADWVGLWQVGDRLFNSVGSGDLVAIDISNPAAPKIAERYHGVLGNVLHIDSQHRLIFTADLGRVSHSLIIYQYGEGGGQVQEVFRRDRYGIAPHDVEVLGNYAYVAWVENVLIFDLRAPIKEVVLPHWENNVWNFDRPLSDLERVGSHVYVAWDQAVSAVNVTNPLTPTIESTLVLTRVENINITITGGRAFMIGEVESIERSRVRAELSMANPGSPTLTPGWVWDMDYMSLLQIQLDGSRAYLLVIDHTGEFLRAYNADAEPLLASVDIPSAQGSGQKFVVHNGFVFLLWKRALKVYRLEESPAQAIATARTRGVTINNLVAEQGVEKALTYLAVIALQDASVFEIKGKCIDRARLMVTVTQLAKLAGNPEITVATLLFEILSLEVVLT